jgi:hypothetical protein
MPCTPPVAAALERWRAMVRARDTSALPPLIHPDAVFRSPMAHKPYASREAVVMVLRAALATFENFEYHRTLFSEDGLSVVLEFSAEVAGKQLKGIDLIRYDDSGLIVEFEVMVRPASGLAALGEAMAARVGQTLPAFKA